MNAINTCWQKGDAFDLVCLARPSLKVRVQWMSLMTQGSSFGIRRSFDWLESPKKLLSGGTVLGVRLQKVSSSKS